MNLFSPKKAPEPKPIAPVAKPAASEPGYQARDARRTAAGASGYQSTLLTKKNDEKANTLLSQASY